MRHERQNPKESELTPTIKKTATSVSGRVRATVPEDKPVCLPFCLLRGEGQESFGVRGRGRGGHIKDPDLVASNSSGLKVEVTSPDAPALRVTEAGG